GRPRQCLRHAVPPGEKPARRPDDVASVRGLALMGDAPRSRLGGAKPVSDNGTKTVRVVCPHDCPDPCAMLVTVRDGVAVDLRGDPGHSFTRGFLCQKVSRYLERVYHPERLAFPMKRVVPKSHQAESLRGRQ